LSDLDLHKGGIALSMARQSKYSEPTRLIPNVRDTGK
jgi:hypothetical protein